ncbi:hypothetical protein [Pleomorphomonas sp. JP5]|uniref:hypothetical protein n=1 Tax=Pleomorphomonas sp. JP5 TaxID=2942998 RepID=UPI0020442DC4|nr:hypothetical protein [Pleomorphomonas sp. JP5]MCM5558507.1 hypothetical protein [Pleomorphomonas sp. JP5]
MAKQSTPVRIRRILIRLAGGQTLCKSFAPNGGDLRFWFEPSQKDAPLKTCLDAIAKGYIVANGDGLFGDSQTYRAVK